MMLPVIASLMFMSNHKEEKLTKNEATSYLSIYLEDEQINYIPDRESGYTLDLTKSSCNNGVTISFDYNTWSVKTNYSNYTNPDNTRVKCSLYFTDKYIEPLLNGTDPVLEDPLIPVTIDDNGVVKKADLSKEWYDYETKKWANAVILEDETKSYASNEVIPEENIESYFVWIPKYRYQLWDLGLYDSLTTVDTSKVHEIPIIFGDYNTSDSVSGECTTPMESGESGNCKVGDYMTHPAFLSIPSTGFWVGKFETGYKGATNVSEATQNINDPTKIQIKPNVYSWKGINLANIHLNSYNYQRELDSHAMKNTEWGAVAYLSHSKYGASTSIRINNHTDNITGYAANEEPTCGSADQVLEMCNTVCNDNTCNTAYPNSASASSTGNNSGFFDVSGMGTKVFAVMADEDGIPVAGSRHISGFNGKFTIPDLAGMEEYTTGIDYPDKRYYDLYLFDSDNYNTTFKRRILGDATGEMGPFSSHSNLAIRVSSWYGDSISQYFSSTYPFGVRGFGAYLGYGTLAGIFSFLGGYGRNDGTTYRIVLTP